MLRIKPDYPNMKHLMKNYPSIFLDSTTIHFWPLPKPVLTEVAEFYIKKEGEEIDETFVTQLKSFITETYDECERFFEALKVLNQEVKVVTSRHIQDFVKLVLEFRSRQTNRINAALKNYEKGINQLNMAKKMLDERTKEIAAQRERIKDKNEEIEQRNTDLNNLKADLEAKYKEQADERAKLQSLNTLYENKQNELNVLMKEVEPYYEKANEELKRLTITDCGELESYSKKDNISAEIQMVCQAVKIISHVKEFKEVSEYINELKANPVGCKEEYKVRMNQATLRKLEKISKKKEFNFQLMTKKSAAVGQFCNYVLKLEMYANSCLQFGPKIEKVVEQKKKLDESKAKLDELDKHLETLNLKQQSIEDEIEAISGETGDFNQQLIEMETDATNAQGMLGQLENEKKEYIVKKEALEKEKQFIDGDSILAAGMMVYGGICFEKQRPTLIKKF